MKNIIKWLTITVLLVVIIAGATFLYNNFSEQYAGENLAHTPQSEPTNESSSSTQSAVAAPDFTVLDYTGNEVKLSDYKGKPVVLNFWATWCYYCKVEMPDFNTAYKKYPDVQFLMVNATDGVQETVDSAKKYIESQSFEFDVFFDTQLQAVNAYRVTGFPTTYFIDKEGNLIAQGNGKLDLNTLETGIKMITE